MKHRVLVKRYAQAFVHCYVRSLRYDQVADIRSIGSLVRPLLYSDYAGVVALLTQAKLDPYVSLLNILRTDKRLFLFPSCLEGIYDLYVKATGRMVVTIETAVPLNEDEAERLLAYLADETGRDIIPLFVEDRSLQAGLRVYGDAIGFEHSVRKALADIRWCSYGYEKY